MADAIKAPKSAKTLYHAKVFVDVDQNLEHTAYIYAGLFELVHGGLVEAEFIYPKMNDPRKSRVGEVGMYLEVSRAGVPGFRQVSFDLKDQTYEFQAERIRMSDVHFKRSFYLPDIQKLPEELRVKVRPFGLNYGCRTFRGTRRLLQSAVKNVITHWTAQPSADRMYYTRYFLRNMVGYSNL